jgi:HEAT repeat protein
MMRVCLFALLLLFACTPVLAQDAPDLDELWRTGSLWQVGDNRDRVDVARQAIIDAGEPGLEYAVGKLGVTDTLQIRCLRVVILGFGKSAVQPLIARISHEDSNTRRNTADLLADLNDQQAAAPLLAQARTETVLAARLSQLAALSKWGNKDAIPLIIEVSKSSVDRIRHRAASLLGAYSDRDAVLRLIDMLDDEIFYVRDSVADALAKGEPSTRAVCLERLREQLTLPVAEQRPQRIRLLLPVVATLAHEDTPGQLMAALAHPLGSVRGDAAEALVTWRLAVDQVDTDIDIAATLRKAIATEYDPFAKTALEGALERFQKAEVK